MANRRNAERLRTVSELYPEIVDTEAGEDELPSCSAIEALQRQEPFINQTLAASALAMLAQLFHYGKKLAESENNALTTPMSFTGTAAELDEQLPAAISSFVASHLDLKNTLSRAKEEMDAAAKAAQEEARNKAKNAKKTSADGTKKAALTEKDEPKQDPESPRIPSLFDAPAKSRVVTPPAVTGTAKVDEEDEILAEISDGAAASSASDEVDEADAAACEVPCVL